MLNNDYRDILRDFNEEKVEYLLIGAYAMAAHGYPRATMDIDLWVNPTLENAALVLRALKRFGAPCQQLTAEELCKPGMVFQIGVAPRRIDILTEASGLVFPEAFRNAAPLQLAKVAVRVLSLQDIIRNKRASGRTKDFADIEALEQLM